MANIKIEPSKARATLDRQQTLERDLRALAQDVENVRSGLRYKISGQEAINARLREAMNQISRESESSKALRLGLEQIINRYTQTEKGNFERIQAEKTSVSNDGKPDIQVPQDLIDWLKQVLPTPIIPRFLTSIIPLELLLTGIPVWESASVTSNAGAGWLGYEFSDGHPGVTAWVGKAYAEASSDWGNAGVNAYLGKVKADADADAHFMSKEVKKKYVDGEWTEKETFSVIDASAKAGVSGSILAADGKAEAGNDYLGVEVSAEGGAGNATAEVKGEFSVGDDGVTANVSGKAMVSAVEGKASGTINILGIEITGEIGGYAGAAGVEGKVGFEDNKFVVKGGAAALLGVSGGIEIGFNETGWTEFWDMVTFWD